MDLDRCNAAGARIAEAVPVVDRSDAEVVERWRLVAEELASMGVHAGPLVWRHTLHDDGGQHGLWSYSDEQAAIECAMWWHVPVVAVSIEPISELVFDVPAEEPTLW
ncbi:hypothetical protein C5D09_06330 [Rathayibacter sp. AY1C9]|uniref:hypothetical protein n=1 Tax=Rathayibacter sp. AY1C9 TaxID=2080541 RepID=UPI000CE8FAC4|nr:hypothetical protein [Rathayibacter sp. AY1C9]PPH46993.1 hypothetical protein C5D09_06330 [Rathayibacter sp. AY1C9]